MSDTFFSLVAASGEQSTLNLQGEWTVNNITTIEHQLNALNKSLPTRLAINSHNIEHLDTVGIWLLLRWKKACEQKNIQIDLNGFPDKYKGMVERVQNAYTKEMPPVPALAGPVKRAIIHLGKACVEVIQQNVALITFLGLTLNTFFSTALKPKQWKVAELTRHIEETGINAMPIVSLGAFLISVVLAYQGAFQLQKFGADIYTVDLISISILREMGVLLTAILVAGRSGSAFAAELGMMQVNEEIDALRTLGLSPFNVLVLPRMMGLMISLPLLAFLADIMGLLGGIVMTYMLMDITFVQFVTRLQEAVEFSTYWVGIVKAPFFAIIISLVGCIRGMQATGSAEKVGQLTTRAVVESIFLVVLMDAVFSILFTKWGV